MLATTSKKYKTEGSVNMANPRVIEKGTEEYKRLEAIAAMLEAVSPNEAKYVVEDVYFDYGQNWMWTTICRRGYSECQILDPVQWEYIILSKGLNTLLNAAEDIRNDKYLVSGSVEL